MTGNRPPERERTRNASGWCLTTLLAAALGWGTIEIARAAPLARQQWAFRKPLAATVPSNEDLKYGKHVESPIDAFVLRSVEEQGLTPAPRATRETLVRRAYFDLLGLPPSPEQAETFVADDSEDAWPRLIDQLLESKHYGERWGRHWLDVARYADSGGYETDIYYRNAWRYRDYVVDSFNKDKPYDRFVQEQIAGDELWPDNLDLDPKRVYKVSEKKLESLEARTGTSFYSLGPWLHESGLDANKLRYERMTDWVDTTASVFLGVTLGCARCHEHKIDPFTQRDYYAMQAVFSSSKLVDVPMLTAMELADWQQSYPRLLAVVEAATAYKLFEERVGRRQLTTEEEAEKQRLLEHAGRLAVNLGARSGTVPRSKADGLLQMPTITALGPERPELIKPARLLDRGELTRAQDVIPPAFPAVLTTNTQPERPLSGPYGNRKELALWLTRSDHPLTARVMVNRVWQWHFGRGIVATPNDFGGMGAPPTHPALLDWLALEFIESGWSVKELHRLIMNSGTYQQSSRYAGAENVARDPTNRYLWRMSRRRLEAEALWDAVHAVAATLNLEMGGRPVVPPLAEDEIAGLREPWHWPVSADPRQHTRRGLYVLVRRNFRFPMFETFDAPVNSVSCPERSVTTVAPQALWGLNNRSLYRQAEAFAARVVKEGGEARAGWVEQAWKIALGRAPTADEKREALELMAAFAAAESADGKGTKKETDAPPVELVRLCLGIYNLNEFAFVD